MTWKAFYRLWPTDISSWTKYLFVLSLFSWKHCTTCCSLSYFQVLQMYRKKAFPCNSTNRHRYIKQAPPIYKTSPSHFTNDDINYTECWMIFVNETIWRYVLVGAMRKSSWKRQTLTYIYLQEVMKTGVPCFSHIWRVPTFIYNVVFSFAVTHLIWSFERWTDRLVKVSEPDWCDFSVWFASRKSVKGSAVPTILLYSVISIFSSVSLVLISLMYNTQRYVV